MSESNRRFLLRQRPEGRITDDTFELVEEAIPEIADGEALVRTQWMSLDPTNRAWIGATPTYLPPVAIGEVMRAVGLGQVVASKHDAYREGQLVQGLIGWQEWAVASDSAPLLPVPELPGVSSSWYLGVLGATGLTAWVGLTDIGRPQPGETIVVSAAAGAVGSVAVQMAKIKGARVVGVAGGSEKCALLTDRLGIDAAVDHRAADWHEQLVAATPNGIDVDFENVGGQIMDAVFARLNLRARVALCGLISGYNDPNPPAGPRTFSNLLVQRATLQGFIVLDHLDRITEAATELGGLDPRGQAATIGDDRGGVRAAAERGQHAVRRSQHGKAGAARRPVMAAGCLVVNGPGRRRVTNDERTREMASSNPVTVADLEVERVGRGPAVVFVHGSIVGADRTWRRQRELAANWELCFANRPGFGASRPLPRGDFELEAPLFAELLGDGAHLVGHSYGAVIALLAAARRPEATRSLVVSEPGLLRLAAGPEADAMVRARRAAVSRRPGAPARRLSALLSRRGAFLPRHPG